MKPRPRALGCTWPCSASNLSWSLNPSAANSTDSTAMAVGRRDGRYIWGPEIMGFVSTPYPARESVFSWSVYVFIYIYIYSHLHNRLKAYLRVCPAMYHVFLEKAFRYLNGGGQCHQSKCLCNLEMQCLRW